MSKVPTPDTSWKSLPGWLFFAFFVIGPPTAFVAFARTLTQNPFLIVGIVIGYEGLIFLLRFAGKIWQQIEKPLIDHITYWIKLHVQELISGYLQHYHMLLISEHQVFDVKGLSTRTAHDLELERVFVDLRLDPTAPHQTWADPLRLPVSLREGTHSIWDYLSSPELAQQHVVIVGAPGSGKTTLLKHLALILAQTKKYPHVPRLRQTFPILLFLRDHAQSIADNPNFSLVQAMQDHIQRKWQQEFPTTWLSRYLDRGKCLILLDGLDEVADAVMRQLVVAWVQRQLLVFGRNRFMLTSRPYGYRDNPLDGVTVLQVQSFTPEQVAQFVQNWYLANELKSWGKDDLGVKLRARDGAQDLLRRLHQAPALLALAINPLLLTMIATVHRERASLPGKRVALYAEICEVFLGKRQEIRGIAQDLSPAQKQKVLQPLAYYLMRYGIREIDVERAYQIIAPHLALVNTWMTPSDFLRLVENTSGLLLERNPGIYGFAHLTFQEYLTAVYIKEEGLEHVLIAEVANSWMHETTRLYCAQADATALVLACLEGDRPTVAALTLAFECEEEKLMIQPQAQVQLNNVLETGMEDQDPERRHVIGEALLRRRMRHMVHLREQTYIDTELVTCAEYQLFLDDQNTKGSYYQPDHWQTASFPPGQGRSPVLGVRYIDAQAFCVWLTQRDFDLWSYRLPVTDDLKIQNKNDVKALNISSTTGYWVDGGNLKIQMHPYTVEVMSDCLRKRLEDDFSRSGDLTPILDFDPAFDLNLAFDRDATLDPDFSFARDFAIANDFALARTRVRNLAIDLGPSYDFVRDLVRDLDLALDHVRDLTRELALERVIAHDLDLDLAYACDIIRELGVDLDSDRTRDLARDLDLTLDRARDLARDLGSTHARSKSSDLTRDLTNAHDLVINLAQIHNLSLVLRLSLDLLYTLAHIYVRKTINELQSITIRWYIRYVSVILARTLRQNVLRRTSGDPNALKSLPLMQTIDSMHIEHAIESYLDLALTFALIEERIEGKLPAWEGILLVKEPTTSIKQG